MIPDTPTLQSLLNRTGALLIRDGIIGPRTRAAILAAQQRFGLPETGLADARLVRRLENLPPLSPVIGDEGAGFIIRAEIGTAESYAARWCRPHWPGGFSGVTLGFGYDLRFRDYQTLLLDWSGQLPAGDLGRLIPWCGKPGSRAAAVALDRIIVPFTAAMNVFTRITLPEAVAAAQTAFAGLMALPMACRAALVSLVYNRGARLDGPRREEMRVIASLLPDPGRWGEVPAQFDAMARLWPEMPGLAARRRAEGALWRRGLQALAQPTPDPCEPVHGTVTRTVSWSSHRQGMRPAGFGDQNAR